MKFRTLAARSMARFALAVGLTTASAAGCSSAVGGADEAAQREEADRRDPLDHLETALAGLELTAEQKAHTDAVVAELRTRAEPIQAAKSELVREVARGVRAGAFDDEEVAERVGALKTAVGAAKPALQAELDALHGALDEGQREDLLEAMVDQARAGKSHRRDKMRRLAEELELTEDQIDAIKDAVDAHWDERKDAARERFGAMRQRMHELADAFEGDDFDAVALDAGTHLPEATERFSYAIIETIGVALPHLTADQRAKLADRIEARAQ